MDDMGIYLFYIVSLLLIIFIARIIIKSYVNFFKEITSYQKAIFHLIAAPECNPDIVTCYVKFTGRVTTEKNVTSILFKKTARFFWSRVMASWQTKQKKPKKGVETHYKVLWTDSSTSLLSLTQSELTVQIDLTDFINQGKVNLPQQTVVQSVCPSICQDMILNKYKQYHLKEIILQNELVTVYGKLIKNSQQNYSLVTTGLIEYPSAIILASDKAALNTLQRLYQSKIKNLVFTRVIVTLLLIATAYFFINLIS